MIGRQTAEGPATLANWREAPWNLWAFHHVRELIPTAEIVAGSPAPLVPTDPPGTLPDIAVPDSGGGETALLDLLRQGHTTGLVVLKSGRLAAEWYDRGYNGQAPHLLFSISKSITGCVAGILAGRGLLDPEAPVTDYVPEVAAGAYGTARVRHLLDMTVSTGFEESYLSRQGSYGRYRAATGWNPPIEGERWDLHRFLATLEPAEAPHGQSFHYVSPNSDLLGWVLERAAGQGYPGLASQLLWKPMGTEAPASVTVDPVGAARSAGGISARLRDLARLGELMRKDGGGIVPQDWVEDTLTQGDRQAWRRGDLVELFPAGSYRNQWYQTGHPSGAFAAVGIHGQWLWVDRGAEVVVAKTSAQPEPIDDAMDQRNINLCAALAAALA
ncbi:MAG: serine hydrolase [Pseudomonadota bacterium]